MAGNARRTLVGGVRGRVWASQTKVRRPDCLARYVARRSRAPYLRRWALIIALARGQEVGEAKALPGDSLADLYGDLAGEHRPGRAEGVEFAALAARVDALRQLGQERLVVRAPDERLRELPG